MQEGCTPERAPVGPRRGALGGVENKLNFAVLDGVDNVRPAFGDLVDLDRGDALLGEVTLRARRRHDAKSQSREQSGGFENTRLIGVADRDKDRPAFRQARAAAELALGEGNIVVAVDAHDLAGRLHLRTKDGVDLIAETRERKHGFLDADVADAARLEVLRLELEALKRLARHDARRDLGGGDAG